MYYTISCYPLWWLERVYRFVFILFYFLFSFPLLAVRVNFYLLAMLGRWERCQKEDVKHILKGAVRNGFDISDKGKGYCTQLFSSGLLVPFLVNHSWNQRDSSSWLVCPMHIVNLASRLDLALQDVPSSWVPLSLPVSPGQWGKQTGQFRGSPGLSPHDLFPSFCKSKKCLLIQTCVLQGDLGS